LASRDSIGDFKEVAASVMDQFLVIDDPAELLSSVEAERALLPKQYEVLAEAFAKNIRAAVSTVGMPLTLAYATAQGSHWQRIHTAERIRALKLEAESGEDEASLEARRDQAAFEHATERLRALCSSDEGCNRIAADACRFLLDALHTAGMAEAASELLLQGEVLVWSALEILTRSLFETMVNDDPKRILTVLKDPAGKRRLPTQFGIEELAAVGFDVSTSLGSLLSCRQDFSDLRTIRATLLPALDAESAAISALADVKLWVLCQRRHLIVHRRGVIDAQYVEAVGESAPLGSRLEVTPNELEAHIKAVASAGTALLAAAARLAA
jgi:hypothetical protein